MDRRDFLKAFTASTAGILVMRNSNLAIASVPLIATVPTNEYFVLSAVRGLTFINHGPEDVFLGRSSHNLESTGLRIPAGSAFNMSTARWDLPQSGSIIDCGPD